MPRSLPGCRLLWASVKQSQQPCCILLAASCPQQGCTQQAAQCRSGHKQRPLAAPSTAFAAAHRQQARLLPLLLLAVAAYLLVCLLSSEGCVYLYPGSGAVVICLVFCPIAFMDWPQGMLRLPHACSRCLAQKWGSVLLQLIDGVLVLRLDHVWRSERSTTDTHVCVALPGQLAECGPAATAECP